jgi:hypothetical protein
MLGAAVLTIAAAIESARGPAAAGQIPLTRNEIAHLLAPVTAPPGHDAGHRLRWSHWRRRHQHRARTCHYQRQITQDHAIKRSTAAVLAAPDPPMWSGGLALKRLVSAAPNRT